VKEQERFFSLVDSIYDAALDSERWAGVMAQLSQVVDSQSAMFRIIDEPKQVVNFGASFGYDEAYMQQYRAHYVKVDPLLDAVRNLIPYDEVWPSQRYIPPPVKKGEFYNDYLVPQDKEFLMGFHLQLPGQRRMIMGSQRSVRCGGFELANVQVMQRLVPHFKRAFSIATRLQAEGIQRAASLSVLSELPFGVLLLSGAGTVQYMNSEAEGFMAQSSVLSLKNSQLQCSAKPYQKEVDCLVQSALKGHLSEAVDSRCMGITVCDSAGLNPIRLHAIPLSMEAWSDQLGGQPSVAAIFLYDGSHEIEVNQALLSCMYGLTPAETQLATELVKGRDISEISELTQKSKLTLRSQLKTIFHKLGVKRQSQLVRLLASSMTSLKQKSCAIGHGERTRRPIDPSRRCRL